MWLQIAAHITVQNSYFFGTQNTTSQSYGLEPYYTDANLLVNNIFQQVTQPIVFGSATGTVFGYNFSIDNVYTTPSGWMEQMSAGGHDAGTMYNLIEGNIGQGYWNDVFHGTGALSTNFRNYWVGWQPGKTESTTAIQLESYQRMMNMVGNVLGCNNSTSSYPGNCGSPYQKSYTTNNGVGNAGSIFDLNAGNSQTNCGISPQCTVLDDPYITTSLMRWGNYDVVNATARFVNSEVPSNLSDGYANPVPSSQALPASFWTPTKPAWWVFPSGDTAPWPGIGPDVSGGNIPGLAGHAYFNPAANCYLNVMSGTQDGTGSMLSFNADSCYPAGAVGNPPNPPTGVTAVAH